MLTRPVVLAARFGMRALSVGADLMHRPALVKLVDYFSLNSTCTKNHVHRINGLRVRQAARDTETEQAFWRKARDKVFQTETAWQELVRNKLGGLAAAH